MANSATNSTAAVTSHMARALKNSFLWNHKFHMTEILGGQGPAWPESKAGRDAWTAFYEDFAKYLDQQFGREAVSNCLDYLIETKKEGDIDHAVSLLIGHPWGPTPAATAAAPTAAPVATDPKTMLTQAFLAGTISVEAFTQAVAALDGVAAAPAPTAKPKLEVVQPEPEAEAEVEVEVEAESAPLPAPVVIPVAYEPDDDDLPF